MAATSGPKGLEQRRTERLWDVRAVALCVLLPIAFFLSAGNAVFAADDTPGEVEAQVITAIEIKGLERVSELAVLAKIETKVGSRFSRDTIQRDIHRLNAWGQFEKVESVVPIPHEGGVKVVFTVTERRIITSIVLKGCHKADREDILTLLQNVVGRPFANHLAVADTVAIEAFYRDKGFSLVYVTYKLIRVQNGTQLVYNISEGPKVKVKEVNFLRPEGAAKPGVSDRELKKFMQTRTYFPVFRGGDYDEDVLLEDVSRLNQILRLREGFWDANVELKDVRFSPEGDRAYIDLNVVEGERYRIGSITFDGNAVLTDEELIEVITFESGDYFSWEEVGDKSVERLLDHYGVIGRAMTQVDTVFNYRETEPIIDVVFLIKESAEIYIRRILVRGNHKTLDKVVRRELSVYPGQLLDGRELRLSLERLRMLGFFDYVAEKLWKTPEDSGEYDLVIDVVEKGKTGRFNFGGSISPSNMEPAVFMAIRQRNFDITDLPDSWGELWPGNSFVGAGQDFMFRVEPSLDEQNFIAAFREPYLFDKHLGFNVKLSYTTGALSRYDYEETAGSIGFDRRFFRKLTVRLSYSRSKLRIFNMYPFVINDIKQTVGNNYIHTLSLDLDYNATKSFNRLVGGGYSAYCGAEYAGGLLGGTLDYTKVYGGVSKYFTVYRNEEDQRYVLSFHSNAAIVEEHSGKDEVQFLARLSAPRVRGFDAYGPQLYGEYTGGVFSAFGSTELSGPLPSIGDSVRWVAFCDLGTLVKDFDHVSARNTRISAGVGLRVNVPFLGEAPLKLDFGIPINERDGDDTRIFSFGFQAEF